MSSGSDRATIAITIGDPCGIGPEVIVKALAGKTSAHRVLLIGDSSSVLRAATLTGASVSVHRIKHIEHARFVPGCLDVLDPGNLLPTDVTPGRVSPACGRATQEWWQIATSMAESRQVGAIVKGPISSEAEKLAMSRAPEPAGRNFLLLITGALRVVHLTDHIPLRQAIDHVTTQNVLELLRLTNARLARWGVLEPRIALAGLNPHCQGPEDEREIAPAIRMAQAEGILATGPISPDTVFRQAAHGEFDCVLAHYHDQGHIAVKTLGFDGNCALTIGSHEYVRISVAHGTALDIAGKGIADPKSMLNAINTAANLADGKGFPAR